MKKLIFIVLICLSQITNAQKYELGKVTVDELKQTSHPIDPTADAAILFNKGRSYFQYLQEGVVMITEVETKIKIYKKDGYEYGNKEVPIYIGGNTNEVVSFSKAFTYNLVNGKIEKTKLSSDGIFEEKKNKKWASKKIAMPNVKEGSIIEYKYTIRTPYYQNLYTWNFQSVIPTDFSEYITEIPYFFVYNYFYRGSLKIDINSEEYKDLSSNTSIVRTTMNAKKIPAFKEEPYCNNIDNYISSIEYELSSVKHGNSEDNLAESWDDVVKKIYDDSNFGPELKKKGYFKNELEVLLKRNYENDEEKINAIFEFVKNRMKWNEFTGINTDVGVDMAYRQKVGNVAEINFILIAMLREAGFDSSPIILSSRSKPIHLYPSITAFNYVICGVEMEDVLLLLDATEPYSKINVLPTRALNYFGRIIRKTGSSAQINLSPNKHAKETYLINGKINNLGEVEGQITESFTERAAFLFRAKHNSKSEEAYLEEYEKEHPGIEISNFQLVNKNNVNESLKKVYNYTDKGSSEIISNKIYLRPFLNFGFKENPFKLENRDYPVDFVSPFLENYTINYEIPEGYEIENLPKQLNMKMPENLGSFSYLIGQNGNGLQIVCNFSMNSSFISAEMYPELKEFFNQAILKMNEKIVLKKI